MKTSSCMHASDSMDPVPHKGLETLNPCVMVNEAY